MGGSVMAIYVLLSRIAPDATADAGSFRQIADKVKKTIQKECPEVEWKSSYVTFGRFDVIDVFEAPSEREAQRVAMIIRRFGKATTETMQAIPWDEFLSQM
jgi:uncharacterized protein with GYD domain